MRWGLIFEDPLVAASIKKLDIQGKTLLVACYLYRQIRLIKKFDEIYSENLQGLFVKALLASLTERKDFILAVERAVQKNIPDTEEFSETY
jgi:hypothetical protein